MRICVIGSGYVGLVTAAVFSDMGSSVICADIDEGKIASLNNQIMPIYEPGLTEMVKRNMDEGRIVFTTNVAEAVAKSEIVFICVGTPSQDNGETNLSYVKSAAKMIGENINGYTIIVNKSTVPVGTGDLVRRVVAETGRPEAEFDVVSNPEFLKEGSAIADALNPDRIVIGAPTKKVAKKLEELYAAIGAPVFVTDVPSAELIKYASNAFLATKISFINAIADICEKVGANVSDVAEGMGRDKRIGKEFLNAGLGFGGSCFPKDVSSLIHTCSKLDVRFTILESVVSTNHERVPHFIERIIERFPDIGNCAFGILGLAFKPDTDDMREAKSLEIINLLLSKGAKIKAFDPVAMDNAKGILTNVEFCDNPYDVAEGADALILITEWREFRTLDMERIKSAMKTPVIFDGRNMYDPKAKAKLGIEYYGIGRGKVK